MAVAQFHKALSEQTRLRIMALILEYNEVCVCDLVTVLEMPQGSVSRHLSYLKKSGLVESVTRGTWRFYQLNQAMTEPLLTILKLTLDSLKSDCQVQRDLTSFKSSNC